MHLSAEQQLLADALVAANRAVSTRVGASPVLGGVWLQAGAGRLRVTGTDLDLTIEAELPVKIEEEGSCVVPARLAMELARALPSGVVTLTLGSDELVFRSGRVEVGLRTFEEAEFPVPSTDGAVAAVIPGAELVQALGQVVRSAATDESRPLLTGVLIERRGDALRLVSTDSYRLGIRELSDVRVEATWPAEGMLIPARALAEVQRALGASGHDASREVEVAIGTSVVTFRLGDVTLHARPLEGRFPDYERLIPPVPSATCELARGAFLEGLRRANLLVRDSVTPVRLHLEPDAIRLEVVSRDVARGTETVEARLVGEPTIMAFNASYLTDGVEAVRDDRVVIELLDQTKPAVVHGVGDATFRYLLMPIRIA
jgi:DNA polymerase-3 subunit beta